MILITQADYEQYGCPHCGSRTTEIRFDFITRPIKAAIRKCTTDSTTARRKKQGCGNKFGTVTNSDRLPFTIAYCDSQPRVQPHPLAPAEIDTK